MTLDDFRRQLLLSVDVRGYGRSGDVRQHEIQRLLSEMLDAAAGRAGLDRAGWQRQPAGDGELSVLPAGEPEVRLVDDFVRELAAELRFRNRDELPADRMRMRVAVHHGVVRASTMGFAGKGVVEVSRLADSAVAHLALDRSDADLVVVLSRRIFEDTVEHTSLEPARLRRVTVEHKEFREAAWLLLPGRDIHAVDLDPPAEPDTAPDDGASAGSGAVRNSVQVNHGNVVQARDIHGGVVMGDRKR
ncbi:hypothetical protein ACFFX1_11685 [Dactylosporangium sucinum]|uniref:Uncharacterized protein n=1 Tax=Dactylosporangium sucinum TaxID=1424081 RepID=A0A917WU19_9ACTN|nr:hypothetical protein [Dactylosporangium sucinum]GGM27922.1 hypothetical protein GCM10007977_031550 [Dactylosporangium sucinum]